MIGRVLILLENEPFPHDRRVRQEARALTDAGYEVTVVCPTGPRALEREVVVDGVRILRFDLPQSAGGVFGYVREYALAALRMRSILVRLRRDDESPFAVVIACNPPDFLMDLARPFRRAGSGLVFDYHDPSPELFETMFSRRSPIHRILLALERRAFRTADVVMTVNGPCAELVRARGGVSTDRIHVIINAPDPRRFFPVAPTPELRDGREHLVLWVGRMSRKERLDLLVEAADELVTRRGRKDVAFAIVGRGDIRDELLADIARRGLDGVITLPGEAEDDELRKYMATADVCVSVDERNGLNDRSIMIKVLEYMAMGRPVVQFPLTEMHRICGDACVYAQDGDAVDLADQIAALLDDPSERARIGALARRRILAGLTWPAQVPELLQAVEKAAAIGRVGQRR